MIYYDNKQHCLGIFDTKQEAALAYDRKARQCGKDKPLNYESLAAAREVAAHAQAEHILVHDMCAGPQQPRPRPSSGVYGVSAVSQSMDTGGSSGDSGGGAGRDGSSPALVHINRSTLGCKIERRLYLILVIPDYL
jgi:hypothetical protein